MVLTLCAICQSPVLTIFPAEQQILTYQVPLITSRLFSMGFLIYDLSK